MQITTKANVGDSVYIKHHSGYLAHKVLSVSIEIPQHGTYLVGYNLTRNTEAECPSGGDLPLVAEELILTSLPTTKLTRTEVYNILHSNMITRVMELGHTKEYSTRKASIYAVTYTEYCFHNQDELPDA